MAERPILFSAPMVRSILAGTKTQTRRVVKYAEPELVDADGWPLHDLSECGAGEMRASCPYGGPGDRLWVRETWGEFRRAPGKTVYRADNDMALGASNKWHPSIHMHRWRSRITLEITGVRVERLQDISEADAKAEGVTPKWEPGCSGRLMEAFGGFSFRPAASAYAELWEQINGPGSWSANPWVWVVAFKRVA
jgi:hypothetical protein